MIQKIKDMMAVQEQVEVLKNNMQYANNSVSELKQEIASLKDSVQDSMEDIKKQNERLFSELRQDVSSIKQTKADFEKALFDFKLLKSQMQKSLMDKFEEELNKELNLQLEKLQADSEQYRHVKENIGDITNNMSVLSDEIRKFSVISRGIKQGDFELSKYARHLASQDKEKLELMRKIDALERLVSKMRRSQHTVMH